MRVVVGLFVALCAVVIPDGRVAAQVETYAAMPRIWDAELSPDGSWLATGCSPRGQREICLYDLAGDTAPGIIPAPDGGEITGFIWPSNSFLIYYASTAVRDGVRTTTVSQPISYSVATGSSVLLMAHSNFAAPMVGADDRVAMQITYAIDTSTRTNTRIGGPVESGTIVYEMDLSTGRRIRRMEVSAGSTIHSVLNLEGEMVLDIRYDEPSGRYAIRRRAGGQNSEVYSGIFPASLPRFYGLTDSGAAAAIRIPELGLRRLDIGTGALSEFSAGGVDVSLMAPVVDEYASQVVGFRYTDNLPRQVFIDPDLLALQRELRDILTEDSFVFTAWTPDRSKLVIEARDSGQPANIYLLDLNTGGLALIDVETALPEGQAPSPRQYFEYPASDGMTIPAYYTLPPGRTAEGAALPLIVLPHGGPRSRDTALYDWWAAFYASRGYAVLQPNFRGSSGYGGGFERAGYGEFGSRMIDDIIDGARYMREQGIARPGPYCVVGASYGGYAALMTALRDPANVACAVSFAGVTDPFAFLASRNPWESTLRYWEQYMGDRFANRDQKAEITPAARADELRMPLLVLHGELDTTVPHSQLLLLRNAMGGRNNVRFVTMREADHYLGTPEARTELLRESQSFLDEHFPAN